MPEKKRGNRYSKLFAEADKAFNGEYKEELAGLIGLSGKEIDSAIPGTKDLEVYSILVKVVEKASQDNLAQSELIENIRELGDVAVKIAKKVPRFAALLK